VFFPWHKQSKPVKAELVPRNSVCRFRGVGRILPAGMC